MPIEPFDYDFQREARIEARGSGVRVGEAFGAQSMFVRFYEIGGEECELRH